MSSSGFRVAYQINVPKPCIVWCAALLFVWNRCISPKHRRALLCDADLVVSLHQGKSADGFCVDSQIDVPKPLIVWCAALMLLRLTHLQETTNSRLK